MKEATGRSAALEILEDPSVAERFKRQAPRLLAPDLHHPVLQRLFELGTTKDGWDYVVAELVEGVRLVDVIRRGPLSRSRAWWIGAQLAKGLDDLRQAGAIHRDLKPGNILIVTEDRPVLSNVDLVLAPEAGPPDTYGLGSTLYEMLTGRLPDEARRPRSYLELHLQPRSLSVVDDLALPVPGVILDLLDPDPRRRPTLKEVAATLSSPSTTGDEAPETALPLSPTIHLNVWFPGHPGARVSLPVGVATELMINLAEHSRPGTLASDLVTEDAAKRFYEVEHVDVIVLCPGADIAPLRVRLPLPPEASAIARFALTPRRAGDLELSVVLLIEGESIHRTRATLLAFAPGDAATEAAP